MLHYFYPRPPRGGRRTFRRNGTTATVFLSTPSARRATYSSTPVNNSQGNFYPRPPRGGRPGYQGLYGYPVIFLSTPSARRATVAVGLYTLVVEISIHALREEGDSREGLLSRQRRISIHALREEGDRCSRPFPSPSSYFYPRPPRGGRHLLEVDRNEQLLFLSTPSARRATKVGRECPLHHRISIHALREEGDVGREAPVEPYILFLSTPSARRATDLYRLIADFRMISIHALREEGDVGPDFF